MAWNNLGIALAAKGEHDEAIKAYRKAIDDPKYEHHARVWRNLAQSYVDAGKQKQAEDAFNKALVSPDTWEMITLAPALVCSFLKPK